MTIANKDKMMRAKDNYNKIIEEIDDYAILFLDAVGTILDWNKGAEKLKGYKSKEIVGKNFRLFYTKADQEKKLPEKLIEIAILKGKATDEGLRVRKDGSEFWGSILITTVYGEENKIDGFLKITRDLTERKNTEAKLKELNKKLEQRVIEQKEKIKFKDALYRNTLDYMMEGIQMHDFDWKYIYVNDALVNYSTFTKDELLGYTLMEKYPGIEQSDLFNVFKRCMDERISETLETEFVFPNGSKGDFELSIQPMHSGIFILSVDITKRKRAEAHILKVNRLYNFLSQINQSIVHIKNESELLDNACQVAINIGLFKMAWIGLLDENEILNIVSFKGNEDGAKKLLKQSGLNYKDPAFQNIPSVKVLNTGKYYFNNNMQNDPAMELWKDDLIELEIASCISLPVRMFGKVIGIFGLFAGKIDFFDSEEIGLLEEAVSDISFALENFEKEKKQLITEDLLIKNEKRFRALIEKSADMKTLTNIDGNFIYASPSLTKVFGFKEVEFMNLPVFNFFHPNDIPDLMEKRAIILQKPGSSFDFQYRFLHKNGNWIWCEGTLTNLLNDPSVKALVSNFRDISEKKKAEQQKEFDQDNLNALINNTNDLLWSVDLNFKLITFNRSFYDIIKLFTKKEARNGGDVFALVLTPAQKKRFVANYTRAFKGETFTEIEHIESPFETWFEISFNPIRSGKEVIGTACHSRDITERIELEHEREKMISDIILRNKNFERFAYIVSHNLRAPVANILGLTSLLKTNLDENEKVKAQDLLYNAIEQLDDIIKDLNRILQTKNEIIENKVKVYFLKLVLEIKSNFDSINQKDKLNIEVDFSAVDKIVAIKSYMHTIFSSLISNAIKFRNPERDLTLKIKSEMHKGKIRISFKDNGSGVNLNLYGDKIFGLYKRFHPHVEGKGVGLFMTKTQVEVLGGSISVNSEPNVGTEFIVELPV